MFEKAGDEPPGAGDGGQRWRLDRVLLGLDDDPAGVVRSSHEVGDAGVSTDPSPGTVNMPLSTPVLKLRSPPRTARMTSARTSLRWICTMRLP